MTDKEIIEGNSLIRCFENPLMKIIDGWVCVADDGYKLYPVESLNYHSSWDWLMPVVEKIKSLGFQIQLLSYINYKQEDSSGFRINKQTTIIVFREAGSMIEATWLAVVDFIEWHNENKSLTGNELTLQS